MRPSCTHQLVRHTVSLSVLCLLFMIVPGCTSFSLESCNEEGGKVLGEDVPRIRSSTLRMKLADPSAAAARFVPYAAMAAYAYVEEKYCGHEAKISEEEKLLLETIINDPADQGPKWERVRQLEKAGDCEDDLGLYYHVWKKIVGDEVNVVVAFRGTWGFYDWTNGNLRWFTRFFTKEDQYTRARVYSHEIIDFFGKNYPSKMLKLSAAGHSLGGGLAQNVLYDRPKDYLQAYAFDPTPVTGFTDQGEETLIDACACDPKLGEEARIFRFYESYEILTHLRFFHKLFFAPDRHIFELRFGFSDSRNLIAQHSMVKLATSLTAEAKKKDPATYIEPWYAGVGDRCTVRFEEGQKNACSVKASAKNTCP